MKRAQVNSGVKTGEKAQARRSTCRIAAQRKLVSVGLVVGIVGTAGLADAAIVGDDRVQPLIIRAPGPVPKSEKKRANVLTNKQLQIHAGRTSGRATSRKRGLASWAWSR